MPNEPLQQRERDHLRNIEKQKQSLRLEQQAYPLAFSELATYIVETKSSSEGPCIFRLADLVSLYKQRLQQLGLEAPDVNSTRLKDKLLAEFPDLESQRKGRDVLLAFQKDVGLLPCSSSQDLEETHARPQVHIRWNLP